MMLRFMLIFTFFLSFPAFSDVLRDLEHLQLDVLDKSRKVESLEEFFQKHDLKHLENERKKEIYKKQKETFEQFYRAYNGTKKEAKDYLEREYKEYLKIAKSSFSVSDFEDRRAQARYLKVLMDKHEFRTKKWQGFDLALIFLANRIGFSYDQALEHYQGLPDSQIKQEFRLLIKRFLELEYKMADAADIPDAYNVFMK